MALREIIILPDKQLRLISRPIEKVTAEIRKLADDMLETMYDAPGIGLAAIQVAEPLRLITMDLARKSEDGETTPQPHSKPGSRQQHHKAANAWPATPASPRPTASSTNCTSRARQSCTPPCPHPFEAAMRDWPSPPCSTTSSAWASPP